MRCLLPYPSLLLPKDQRKRKDPKEKRQSTRHPTKTESSKSSSSSVRYPPHSFPSLPSPSFSNIYLPENKFIEYSFPYSYQSACRSFHQTRSRCSYQKGRSEEHTSELQS